MDKDPPTYAGRIHTVTPAEALRQLGSDPGGLSSAEALRRLQKFGPNSIPAPKRRPALFRIVREFFRFFSVILWVAAALAFAADWADPGEGMAQVGYSLVVVIVISGVFSFWQEHRLEKMLSALQKLLPPHITTLRDGTVHKLPAHQLVIGDVVLLEQGDSLPADCRLLEAYGVKVNTATVTGESIPKPRDADPSRQEDVTASSNVVLAGTSVVAGQGKAVVYATGARTEFGRIAGVAQTVRAGESPLRKELAHLSRFIAVLAIAIGVAFFAVAALIQVPVWKALIFSIGIIVALVPEGLLPTLTLALVLASQRMAKCNVLIRNLVSVETLGSATVICTDKTGTLTANRMHVAELLVAGRHYVAADREATGALAIRHAQFFACAGRCHDVKESRTERGVIWLGDPMEVALIEMQRDLVGPLPASKRLDELPFDPGRMRQAVVHATPDGPVLYCKGAPEAVLPLCTRLAVEDGTDRLAEKTRALIVRRYEEMAEQGLRVVALASKRLGPDWSRACFDRDLVLEGLVGLQDPPRPEVPQAIRRCHEAGIKVIMVTGDHPRTAAAIAKQIGLARSQRPEVITSQRLRTFSSADLRLTLELPDVIFARVTPDDKMRIVEALKSGGHVVAVTGDGVNDAPALKSAHIGIAMGVGGTEVARQAADMVLLDGNFASIVDAVEEGRAVFQNIRKFLTYVLVHNVAELLPYLAFVLFKIPLALTPIQILSIDMGTDSLTALGLGAERPHDQAMRLPPRPKSERLLNLPLALRAYLFLGVIEASAGMAAFFYVLLGGGWTYGEYLRWDNPLYQRATTACLSAIIVAQVVNVFVCRSSVLSVFSITPFSNSLIIYGVALELFLLLAYNYAPWAHHLLGTAPVLGEIWLVLVALGAAMLILEEGRKWLVRHHIVGRSRTNPLSTCRHQLPPADCARSMR